MLKYRPPTPQYVLKSTHFLLGYVCSLHIEVNINKFSQKQFLKDIACFLEVAPQRPAIILFITTNIFVTNRIRQAD
jgi:hypothetical protein